jgi:hypothetical protein
VDELNRLKKNAYMRDWKRRNKDKVNKINLATRQSNRPKYNAINQKSLRKRRAEVPELFAGYRKVHREKHLEQIKEYDAAYQRTPIARENRLKRYTIKNAANPSRHLFSSAKARAKRLGLAFDLCKEDIVAPEKCPVLGIILSRGVGGFSPTSPSVDRVDSAQGYTKDNIRVISWRANRLKSDATIEELEAILAYMKNHMGTS